MIAVIFSQLDSLLKESNDGEYNRLYDQYQKLQGKKYQQINLTETLLQIMG